MTISEGSAEEQIASGNERTPNDCSETKDNDETTENEHFYSPISDRPIVCILEEEHSNSISNSNETASKRSRCRMFRVIRSKGKALASGGFGVTIAKGDQNKNAVHENENDSEEESEDASSSKHDEDGRECSKKLNGATKPSDDNTADATKSTEYLFIEEVLFLHEKGLLRALLPEAKDSNRKINSKSNHTTAKLVERTTSLDTSQLYQLLPSMGISLPIYRVYSHLRSQDFRVLRHDPNRYDILCNQNEDAEERRRRSMHVRQEQKQLQIMAEEKPFPKEKTAKESAAAAAATATTPGKNSRKLSLRLRHMIRESIQTAPPPSIPTSRNNHNDSSTMGICWDAYNPNSNFGKTHPGLPDFYVTATYYNVPMVAFSHVNTLLRDKCNGIPLKVATVSDSGT